MSSKAACVCAVRSVSQGDPGHGPREEEARGQTASSCCPVKRQKESSAMILCIARREEEGRASSKVPSLWARRGEEKSQTKCHSCPVMSPNSVALHTAKVTADTSKDSSEGDQSGSQPGEGG